jgi:predicted porin
MKKLLIAMTALSAAAAANAQSSVTLSGTIDPGIEKISGNPLQLSNSRNGTSQITVSGVEDLGGGLRARFQVATAFDSSYDNAQATGGRQGPTAAAGASFAPTKLGGLGMFAALDSKAGTILLGRPLNTLYSHQMTANGTKGVTGFAATDSVSPAGLFTSNAIQYITPNFSGFTAQLEYAPSEVVGYKSTRSIGLKYASGPFGASLVRDSAKSTALNGDYASEITQLGAFWDFGVAKLSGTYQKDSAAARTSRDDQAWLIGVNVPFGPGQFWAQWGQREVLLAGGASGDARIIGLGYKYSLSKRTTAYVNFGTRNDDAARAAGFATAGKTGYGLGLQHNF